MKRTVRLMAPRGKKVTIRSAVGMATGTATTQGVSGLLASVAGDLTFTISPSHATVTSYEVRARRAGPSTLVLTSLNLGKPTPNAQGQIRVNIAPFLTGLGTGDYEVTVAAIAPTGTVDSLESKAFSVPLVAR